MVFGKSKSSPPKRDMAAFQYNTFPRNRRHTSQKNRLSPKKRSPSPPRPHSVLSNGLIGGPITYDFLEELKNSSTYNSTTSLAASCDSFGSRDDLSFLESDTMERHLLHNEWKFWYRAPQNRSDGGKQGSWSKLLKEIKSFGTVEDFWSIWNSIKSPAELPMQSSYMLFKGNMRPEWEDEGNKHGGSWTLNLDSDLHINKIWREVVMGTIGEMFDDTGKEICGIYCDIRRNQNRISIWTKDCQNRDQILKIGEEIKVALLHEEFCQEVSMNYIKHDDNKKSVLYRV